MTIAPCEKVPAEPEQRVTTFVSSPATAYDQGTITCAIGANV